MHIVIHLILQVEKHNQKTKIIIENFSTLVIFLKTRSFSIVLIMRKVMTLKHRLMSLEWMNEIMFNHKIAHTHSHLSEGLSQASDEE